MSKFKIGDRVIWTGDRPDKMTNGKTYDVISIAREFVRVNSDDGIEEGWVESNFKIAPTGPVVEEVVKRIVPGVYGRIEVSPHAETSVTHVGVRFEPMSGSYAVLSKAELSAAAIVLNQLAEALK